MLDSLKAFRLVAEHQNFRRAAEEIGLTRPAVSHRIKQLETYFDVQLVERTTRRVALTPAGRVLAVHAERVLAAVAEMDGAMKHVRHAERARLTIGASTLPAEKFLSPALVSLRKRLGEHGLHICVRVGNTEQVLKWLEDREIDVAVVGCDVQTGPFVCRPFATDSLVLVVPPQVAVSDPVSLDELKTLPLILREPGSATRQAVLGHLAAHGVAESDLNIVAEMGSADSIMAAVRAGVGCAFFSTNYVDQNGVSMRHVAGISLQRPLSLCWRKDRPAAPPLQAIFDQLSALLTDLSG